MQTLAEFQQQFQRAILQPESVEQSSYGVGLRMYQNTVTSGLIDVLSANYPTVLQLVGETWFRDMARYYVSVHFPAEPSLALYGAELPEFLQQLPSTQTLAYLPGIAHLDRLWTESHFAADAPTLQAQHLQALSLSQLSGVALSLHPATRYRWCEHGEAIIWQHHRAATWPDKLPNKLKVEVMAEGVLITRPQGAIQIQSVSAPEHQFVTAIAADAVLGEAAEQVLQAYPTLHFPELFAKLIHGGAFQSIEY